MAQITTVDGIFLKAKAAPAAPATPYAQRLAQAGGGGCDRVLDRGATCAVDAVTSVVVSGRLVRAGRSSGALDASTMELR